MWFEQIVRDETGCATYLVGSTDENRCIVFDPLWDIAPYLRAADRRGSTITHVIDSHTHADHVSGARRLALRTGAQLLLPSRAEVTYEARRLADGERLLLGEVEVEIVPAPGHRPELINLLVRDRGRGSEPWFLLSADCLMVGDLARPDLAQDGAVGAATLYRESIPRLLALPDFVEVYPGHVAGSTCGRVTSGKAATTIGYERRTNPCLQLHDETSFVTHMLRDQPLRPANLENIVAINQGRRPLTMEEPRVDSVPAREAAAWIEDGGLAVDCRPAEAYASGHIPGTFSISLAGRTFEQAAGWILPPEGLFLLVVNDSEQAQQAAHRLAFVGLDRRVRAFVEIESWRRAGRPLVDLAHIDVASLRTELALGRTRVLDVREASEVADGAIENAVHLPYTQLPGSIDRLGLQPEEPVAVICASGNRSTIASSILLRQGFRRVRNVAGGMTAWNRAGYPTK